MLPLLTGLVLFASCGSDDGESTATSASTASSAGTATSVVETSTSGEATSTTADTLDTSGTVNTTATDATVTTETAATDDTSAASTTETTLAAATESTDVVQGLAAETIGVVVGGSNPARPTFEWTAVTATPVRYQLVVQSADGTPVWAWTGTDTKTVLGGVERPANVEGPTLVGPSRVRVYALADDGSFAGVSPWVAIG